MNCPECGGNMVLLNDAGDDMLSNLEAWQCANCGEFDYCPKSEGKMTKKTKPDTMETVRSVGIIFKLYVNNGMTLL